MQDSTLSMAGLGQIQIRTEPPGAVAFLDNEKVGITPLVVPFVRSGVGHNLRVETENYYPAEQMVMVSDSFMVTATAGIGTYL